MRCGNLGEFVGELERHADVWIGKGVYLLLEKLKVSVYRNLFRLVYLHVWTADVEARGGSEKERVQLPLSVLMRCMKGMGVEMAHGRVGVCAGQPDLPTGRSRATSPTSAASCSARLTPFPKPANTTTRREIDSPSFTLTQLAGSLPSPPLLSQLQLLASARSLLRHELLSSLVLSECKATRLVKSEHLQSRGVDPGG